MLTHAAIGKILQGNREICFRRGINDEAPRLNDNGPGFLPPPLAAEFLRNCRARVAWRAILAPARVRSALRIVQPTTRQRAGLTLDQSPGFILHQLFASGPFMSGLTIGEIARRAGVGIDTVRYYERSDLLPPPLRRASGYREYAASDVRRLRFIRRAKEIGFTLDEIRDLLALSTDRERGVRGIKARAEVRLADIESRIRELQRVRRGLKALVAACPGHGSLEHCPILAALAEDERS